ncbi:MAG TPA: hypothetical protein VF039_08980 [Longimicrobiales bacterium]
MRRIQAILVVLLLSLPMAGCELIGDLLEFSLWVILIFVGILILLGWALRKAFRRRPPPPGMH